MQPYLDEANAGRGFSNETWSKSSSSWQKEKAKEALLRERERETMKPLVDIKTFIPEKGVWVSTVAWDMEIGLERTSETMVFKGNNKRITSMSELDFESHGHEKDEKTLKKLHDAIVKRWREKE